MAGGAAGGGKRQLGPYAAGLPPGPTVLMLVSYPPVAGQTGAGIRLSAWDERGQRAPRISGTGPPGLGGK